MMKNLTKKSNAYSFSVSPENFSGEKGKGAIATEASSGEYYCLLSDRLREETGGGG